MTAARWRTLIERVVHDVWPQLPEGPAWVLAQVHVESGGRAEAVSPVGALGLLQLMPATADELGVRNAKDPEENLRGGVRYLRLQHEHLPEIPGPHDADRLYWSFASYNGGRGYVNKALALARNDPETYWWKWDVGSHWLMHPQCTTASGRRPDWVQMWDYVRRIRTAKLHPPLEAGA